MPTVNPDILVWARETAGLTLQGAVTKIGIKDAHGVAAVDRLAELERGEKEPTRPVLVKMAQHYRRPLLAFYLDAPPPGGPVVLISAGCLFHYRPRLPPGMTQWRWGWCTSVWPQVCNTAMKPI